MKKFLGILLVLVLVVGLVACNNGPTEVDEPDVNNETEIIENQEPVEEEILPEVVEVEKNFPVEDLNKYDVFQFIRLVENPTTGYQWTYAFAPEGIAVVEADEYTAPELEGGIVGAAGEHTYRISGLAEGETDLVFTYARSWEPIEEAAKVVTFRLSVDADMNVAVISEN